MCCPLEATRKMIQLENTKMEKVERRQKALMFIFTGFWPNNVLRLVSDFKLRSKLILYGGSSESDANHSSLWKQFWIFFLFFLISTCIFKGFLSRLHTINLPILRGQFSDSFLVILNQVVQLSAQSSFRTFPSSPILSLLPIYS